MKKLLTLSIFMLSYLFANSVELVLITGIRKQGGYKEVSLKCKVLVPAIINTDPQCLRILKNNFPQYDIRKLDTAQGVLYVVIYPEVLPISTNPQPTKAAVKALVINRYNLLQTEITNFNPPNIDGLVWFGWDGTNWQNSNSNDSL